MGKKFATLKDNNVKFNIVKKKKTCESRKTSYKVRDSFVHDYYFLRTNCGRPFDLLVSRLDTDRRKLV